MAEQEVIKHTKKIYKIWHSKESYISKNKKRLKDNGDNLAVILGADEAKNLVQNLSGAAFIIRDYDACIRKAEKIIAGIDRDKL